MKYNFYKIGGILLKDKKLLVCRSKGKEFFIAPGGKVEKGESPRETLRRELKEELDISIDENELKVFGVFYAPAAGDDKNILRMDVFLVKKWSGQIKPSGEVEEIAWINTNFPKTMKVGSIFEHEVLPRLKERGMID